MFYNVLKRAVQANIRNVNNSSFLRFGSSSSSSGSAKDEIKEALEIEANLFENSLLHHEPVNTRDALRKHRTTGNSKQKVKTQKSAISELIKVKTPANVAKDPAPVVKRDPAPLIKDKELDLEFTRLTLQVVSISIDLRSELTLL